jgi:hypothetical protein
MNNTHFYDARQNDWSNEDEADANWRVAPFYRTGPVLYHFVPGLSEQLVLSLRLFSLEVASMLEFAGRLWCRWFHQVDASGAVMTHQKCASSGEFVGDCEGQRAVLVRNWWNLRHVESKDLC